MSLYMLMLLLSLGFHMEQSVQMPVIIHVPTLITELAIENGIDPQTALRIADCESGMNPIAKNPNSTATGIYQFTKPTWEYIQAEGDRTNPEDNIRAFMEWYPKYPSWWECK